MTFVQIFSCYTYCIQSHWSLNQSGFVSLPIALPAKWLTMFPTKSKASSRISKRWQTVRKIGGTRVLVPGHQNPGAPPFFFGVFLMVYSHLCWQCSNKNRKCLLPLANDHLDGSAFCKWSSGWNDLLYLIIWMAHPLTNAYPDCL